MSLPTPAPIPNSGWHELEFISTDALAHQLTTIPTDALVALVQNVSDTDFTIGPNSNGTARTINPGQEYTLPWTGKTFDLRAWYAKTTAAGKKLNILWCE
jgi:hypothetical protein